MKTILNQSFNRSRNAEHIQYHSDTLAVVTAVLAVKYNFSAFLEAYAALYKQEEEVFAQNQAFEYTKVIESKDLKRDNLWMFIKMTIEGNLLSPDVEKQAIAETLAFAIKPYRNAHELPYAENTAQITSVIAELQREDLAKNIATLGLTDAVAQLGAANTDFNETYIARTDEKLNRVSADKMKTLRPRVDRAFVDVCNVISVLYQANELTTQTPETASELGSVIDRINALSLQLQQTISLRK
jgi:hypothetical protein